ncbi:MAG: trypsin-like peptidase domain-containing protein [Pirellulales bacterium]
MRQAGRQSGLYSVLAALGLVPFLGLPAAARPLPTETEAAPTTLLSRPLDRVPLAQLPHPAVAKVIAPERNAESHGSGTLVDVRDDCGLVITNWHVVRDATGTITVRFPNGFTSPARVRKVDKDWDLAALVIWRPPIEPVPIARQVPRRGDLLTIAGYGPGPYRAATGRCIQYVAPGMNFPPEMVELSAEARQGDSGGPIFNDRGELAGVLFGAARGTTTGSYCGRVRVFLSNIVPNPGSAPAGAPPTPNGNAANLAQAPLPPSPTPNPTAERTLAGLPPPPTTNGVAAPPASAIPDPASHPAGALPQLPPAPDTAANAATFASAPQLPLDNQPPPAASRGDPSQGWTATPFPQRVGEPTALPAAAAPTLEQLLSLDGNPWEKAKTVLALIGLLSVLWQVGRLLQAGQDRTAADRG